MKNKWQRCNETDIPTMPERIDISAVEAIYGSPNHGVPNHPFLPALVYRQCFNGEISISGVKALYERNGWFRVWDWTVYDYHHFHSNAHEVLTCVKGAGQVHLGGPDGKKLKLKSGDSLILPAGFGHKLLVSSTDFRVVGGYPRGQEDRDIIEADPKSSKFYDDQIASVPISITDPIFGDDGYLLKIWSDRRR